MPQPEVVGPNLIFTYNGQMPPVTLEFSGGGAVLTGSFLCASEPELLESGKRGWFVASTHIDWRSNWCLKVHCSITEPKPDYGHPRPRDETCEFDFDPSYCGRLVVADRLISVSFRVPDCFDPPRKKSFSQGQPILLGEKMFHCQMRLELRGPRDGTYLRRRAATSDRVGGIEFMYPGAGGDVRMAYAPDSATGRGREERIQAFLDARRAEYRGSNFGRFYKILEEARHFVDSHPSLDDENT